MLKFTFTSIALFALVALAALGCNPASETAGVDGGESDTTPVALDSEEVEAACGICKFGMEGNSCSLAVRHGGNTYYVDGSSMGDHGDPHGEEGMCSVVRKAVVSGSIEDGRFNATSFEVLPLKKDESAESTETSDESKKGDSEGESDEGAGDGQGAGDAQGGSGESGSSGDGSEESDSSGE